MRNVTRWCLALAVAAALPATGRAAGEPSKELKEGLQKLHAANQAEIKGGQLALQKASSDAVKTFAQKMVDDHTQNDQQLTQLAQAKGVELNGSAFDAETKQADKAMKPVEAKSGAAFDKAYMAAMAKDHAKDEKELRKLVKASASDQELHGFLSQTREVVAGHLQMAKHEEMGTRATAHAPAPAPASQGTGSQSGGK